MIVVTGGTGLVGGHLLFQLIRGDNKVRALIRPQTSPEKVFEVWKHLTTNPDELINRVEWYPLDWSDTEALSEALEGARLVYHCAAQVSFDPRLKKQLWQSNVELTRNLVNTCLEKNISKLLYISSVAAIATPEPGEPTTESCGWPTDPKSVYSKTKTLAELEVWRGIAEGLNAVILNPTVIVGPGNWQHSSARIFDVLYRGLRYTTSGGTGFVDVRDVISVAQLLMEQPIYGERFIVNGANESYLSAFSAIAKALRRKAPSHLVSTRLTGLLWRGEWVWSRLSGQEARITRHSMHAANNTQKYSSKKLQETIPFTFHPLQETIDYTAGCYLNSLP